MKKLILLLAVIFVQQFSAKSEIYNLDLQKSIEIAKEKSYSMLTLLQDFKIAEYNLKAATSRLKTHIDLNFTTPDYSNRVYDIRTDTSITYFSSKVMRYGGSLVINQPLPTAGYLYINTGVFNENTYNSRGSVSVPQLNTTFGLVQPLTALYGYNEVKSTLKLAELAYERSKKGLKREELNLVYQVSNSFYNLLAEQKSTEIALLNFEKQKEAFDISQNKYKAGLIKEVDALQMEVDLAEAQNNYDLSKVNQGAALNEFKQLIGINLSDSVSLNSELKYEVVIVDPEKAVLLAFQNRLEIREQEIAIEQNNINLRKEKSNGMIQSSLNLSFGKEGFSYQPINSSISNSLKESYSDYLNRSPSFGIGLTLKVPILDFGENKAKVNSAESSLKQNQLRKEEVKRDIEKEVRNLVSRLNNSLKSLQLLEKNILVAEKSFEITRQRFSDGDINTESLALERTRLNTAYKSHLSAYISYQLLLADIMRKTFYDFQINQPIK
jgi:outer membrane protein